MTAVTAVTAVRSELAYRVVNRVFRLAFRLLGLRFLDFTFVGLAASRRGRLVRFMAKQTVFDHPLSGPLMRRMRHIPVDRTSGAAAYRRATRALHTGELVGVFPEATISRAWTLKPFKPGAAALAVREQVPLIPVVVWGGHRVLAVDGRHTLRRGTRVTVLVGAPMHPAPDDALDQAQSTYPDRPRSHRDRWWLPAHLGGTAPTPEAAAGLDRAAMVRADRNRVPAATVARDDRTAAGRPAAH